MNVKKTKHMIKNSNQTTSNEDWKKILTVDNRGRVIDELDNYVKYLENHPKYAGKFKYNELSDTHEFDGKCITEGNICSICIDTDTDMKLHKIKYINQAVDYICEKNPYNPVVDYLNSLKWDGEERIATIFNKCFGVEDNEVVRAMAKSWFCGAVRRMFEPGCELTNLLVIANDKYQEVCIFCSDIAKRFFNQYPVYRHSKNKKFFLYGAVSGSWIVCAECDWYSIRKPIDKIRADILYTNEDTLYGRTSKRKCSFIIDAYRPDTLQQLSYHTSDRISILMADGDYHAYDMGKILTEDVVDQLWAEAVHYYKSGVEYDHQFTPDWELYDDYIKYTDNIIADAKKNLKQ